MNPEEAYIIDFKGLTIGVGVAEMLLGDDFFALWPESGIEHGTVRVKAEVRKRTATQATVALEIEATVTLTCDRCLEPFDAEVSFRGEPAALMTETPPEDEDGETLWIDPATGKLDLGQYIYESVMLSLPIRRVHPHIEDCDPEMLKRFSIVSEQEFDAIEAGAGATTIGDRLASAESAEEETGEER